MFEMMTIDFILTFFLRERGDKEGGGGKEERERGREQSGHLKDYYRRDDV